MDAKTAVVLLGLGLFGAGVAMLSVPWALILSGAVLIAAGFGGYWINRESKGGG